MGRTYNIGDRFVSTSGEDYYVVVATTEDPTNPLLLDWQPGTPINADTMNTMTMEWAEEWLGRDPQDAPDQDASAAVVAAYESFRAGARAEHDALTPLEQVIQFGTEEWRQEVRDAVAEYERADQAWKDQQAAVTEAARVRALKMRGVRFLLGTQAATAKALGIDQSNVSRALALLDDNSLASRILDLG